MTERRRLNHPSTVWRKWKASKTVPEPKEESASPAAKLRDANLELTQELDALRAHIKELEASRETEPSSGPMTLGRCAACLPRRARGGSRAGRASRGAEPPRGALQRGQELPAEPPLPTGLGARQGAARVTDEGPKAAARAKPTTKPAKKAAADSGKLVWTEKPDSGVEGHSQYEAKAGGAEYRVAPIDHFPSMKLSPLQRRTHRQAEGKMGGAGAHTARPHRCRGEDARTEGLGHPTAGARG